MSPPRRGRSPEPEHFRHLYDDEDENEDDRKGSPQTMSETLAALAKPSLMHPCLNGGEENFMLVYHRIKV